MNNLFSSFLYNRSWHKSLHSSSLSVFSKHLLHCCFFVEICCCTDDMQPDFLTFIIRFSVLTSVFWVSIKEKQASILCDIVNMFLQCVTVFTSITLIQHFQKIPFLQSLLFCRTFRCLFFICAGLLAKSEPRLTVCDFNSAGGMQSIL